MRKVIPNTYICKILTEVKGTSRIQGGINENIFYNSIQIHQIAMVKMDRDQTVKMKILY
jgi:hypothetical protein